MEPLLPSNKIKDIISIEKQDEVIKWITSVCYCLSGERLDFKYYSAWDQKCKKYKSKFVLSRIRD